MGMKWLTPTHLEVTYRSPRHLNFQAIKWADIDISLRDAAADSTRQAGILTLALAPGRERV